MKIKLLAAALIVILAGGVWWGLGAVKANKISQAQQTATQTADNGSSDSAPATANLDNAPRLDNQGGVEVAVNLEKSLSGSGKLVFTVQMNNHMISLDDYDFFHNTELKLNDAAVPVDVEVLQKNGEGHHVSDAIGVQGAGLNNLKTGDRFTLILKNIAGIPARNFSWTY